MMKRRYRGGTLPKPKLEIERSTGDTEDSDDDDDEMVDDDHATQGGTNMDRVINILHNYTNSSPYMEYIDVFVPVIDQSLLQALNGIFEGVARENREHATPICIAYRYRNGLAVTVVSDEYFVNELEDAVTEFNESHAQRVFGIVDDGLYDRDAYANLMRNRANWLDVIIARCRYCHDNPEQLSFIRRERERERRISERWRSGEVELSD